MSPFETMILYFVGAIGVVGGVVVVPILAIWTDHQRKMAAVVHSDTGATRNEEFERLKADFELMRESLTAHAMSVDENLKALAGRVNSLEQRVTADPVRQNLLGGTG